MPATPGTALCFCMQLGKPIGLLVLVLLGTASAPAQAPDDRVRFLRSIEVAPEESTLDAVCIGCSVHVRGTVGGDVVTIAGNVTVEGVVEDEIVVVGGHVRLLAGARVNDEIVLIGGPLIKDPTAQVSGEIVEVLYFHLPGQRAFHWRGMLVLALIALALALLGGLLLGSRRLENLAASLRSHYLAVPLVGVALFAGVVSLYSLPTLIKWLDKDAWYWAVNVALLLSAVLGFCGMAQYLGRVRTKARGSTAPAAGRWSMLVSGAAAATLLLLIPAFGLVFFLCLFAFGFGMVLVSGAGSHPHWLLERWARGRRSKAPPGT